jgi:hypothetical protein
VLLLCSKLYRVYKYNYFTLLKLFPPTYVFVTGPVPIEVIGSFNWPNPSGCIMALGPTQPLTEMNTMNLPGGEGWPACKADCLENVAASTSHNPMGLHGLL